MYVPLITCTPESQFFALEAGKHVLCEKPMATSLNDAEKMNEADFKKRQNINDWS